MDIQKRKQELESRLKQVQADIVQLEQNLRASQQAQQQLVGALAILEEMLQEAETAPT